MALKVAISNTTGGGGFPLIFQAVISGTSGAGSLFPTVTALIASLVTCQSVRDGGCFFASGLIYCLKTPLVAYQSYLIINGHLGWVQTNDFPFQSTIP